MHVLPALYSREAEREFQNYFFMSLLIAQDKRMDEGIGQKVNLEPKRNNIPYCTALHCLSLTCESASSSFWKRNCEEGATAVATKKKAAADKSQRDTGRKSLRPVLIAAVLLRLFRSFLSHWVDEGGVGGGPPPMTLWFSGIFSTGFCTGPLSITPRPHKGRHPFSGAEYWPFPLKLFSFFFVFFVCVF